MRTPLLHAVHGIVYRICLENCLNPSYWLRYTELLKRETLKKHVALLLP